MKNWVATILLVSITSSQISHAEQALPTEPPPPSPLPSYVTPLKFGMEAPYDGLLLSETAAAEIITDRKLLQEKITIEVQKAKDGEQAACVLKVQNEKTSCKENRALDLTKIQEKDSQIDALNGKLSKQDDAEKRYQNLEKSLPKYIAGGFIVGVATTLLTALAISKISQ